MSRGVLITEHSDVSIESTFLHSFISIAYLLCHNKMMQVNYNLTTLTIKATCSLGHVCLPHEIFMPFYCHIQLKTVKMLLFLLYISNYMELIINVINPINMLTGMLELHISVIFISVYLVLKHTCLWWGPEKNPQPSAKISCTSQSPTYQRSDL